MNKITHIFLSLFVLSFFSFAGCDSDDLTNGAMITKHIVISGENTGDPEERIYVRKVGSGPQTLVLVPGNNTSGSVFTSILNQFRYVKALNRNYTVYTFDYRGSGYSSYNKKIRSLKTFAVDFEKVMNKLDGFPASNISLIGYSMGAAVGYQMVILNSARYSNFISLAGVGTRGTRVAFSGSQAGTDTNGGTGNWNPGDMIPVNDDATGIAVTAFHQRSWQGDARSFATISFTWDIVVFNDVLKYDIATYTTTAAIPNIKYSDTDVLNETYQLTLEDGIGIDYMPDSLYYCHKTNISSVDVTAGANSITIPGTGELASHFTGINVLLVKATTDFATWRGDQVIYDIEPQNSKYDLKQAGATVTAIMIDPDYGYDHGFPVARSVETVDLIRHFLNGSLNDSTAENALNASVTVYEHSETSWEQN